MRTDIIEIKDNFPDGIMPQTALSVQPFLRYLRTMLDKTEGEKAKVIQYIIEQFNNQPGLDGAVSSELLAQYPNLLKLIYISLSPILESEDTQLWALAQPVKPVIFYSTNAFYDLLSRMPIHGDQFFDLAENELLKRDKEAFCYSLILKKCYGLNINFTPEIIYPFTNPDTGITRHFKINGDDRFVDIIPLGELPALPGNSAGLLRGNNNELLTLLKEKAPLDKFRFEGMVILTIADITAEYAVDSIKNILITHNYDTREAYYPQLVTALKTLSDSNDLEFGLFPMLQVNNRLIFDKEVCHNSLLMKIFGISGKEKNDYYFLGQKYFANPKLILLKDIPKTDRLDLDCMAVLEKNQAKSYAILPIFFNNSLAGILEIYAHKEGILDEKMLSRLDPAIPYLAQIFRKNIDDFNNEIERTIKSNFTALQPSVQWKFNEAAWHYLRDNLTATNNKHEIGEISFEKVYPLYGAIDIRNSTIERNEALRKDLEVQFEALLSLLQKLKEQTGFGLIDEKIFVCNKWLNKINNAAGFNEEGRLNDFLETDITPFLTDFKKGNPGSAALINDYFNITNEKNGAAYTFRRQLEHSMTTVISSVNNYLDMMEKEIQKAYPCYFEKFRTDGVEYDIYIGQAISPEKPFSDIYLKNLRLLQLTSMAAVGRYAHSLIPELQKPVETTQLIFIHSHPIDIRFRKDEKRFDVEGAYNIRYHIVKKRIDKVHLKGTKERLTQPNKIALAYFSQKEADEYIDYIRYLQQQNVLEDNLEMLELEPLQGVFGLKALRVGIVLEKQS